MLVQTQLSLKGRALRLLAAREHSRAELERRLAPHAALPDDLAGVLDALQAKGLISDERVAESVIHRRATKLGSGRIRQELEAKGLDGETVTQAMDGLRATEMERAREVWRKKFGTLPADAAERGRQMRFMASRGFASEVIARVLRDRVDADH
jgi:regulatory protein